MIYIRLIFIIYFSFSCIKPKPDTQKQERKDNIVYSDSISLVDNWYINDTIPIKILFDTGAYGVSMTKRIQRLLDLNTEDSLKISNKNFNYIYSKSNIDIREKESFMDKDYNRIIIGWKIFENKIIELSRKEHLIYFLKEVPELKDYKCLYYNVVETVQNKMVIPVTIFIQGKEKKVNLLLDTGFNGSFLISKDIMDDLDCSQASQSPLYTLYGDDTGVETLIGDSIKIGNLGIGQEEIHLTSKMKSSLQINGAIGNAVLDKFSIIFDFRNRKAYLKPL